ncbi:MAG TPA: RraA family protein [Rectinemataceae bacterium]|nr:RraA family protein [Rectinemataceae bacterium]
MSVGFRVFLKRDLPPAQIVEAFRSLPPANVADCMGRLCALSSEIRLLSKPAQPVSVGVALTVKARPGDNLMIHRALNIAGPGDFIVVANEGDRSHSLIGEVMATFATYKQIAGLILDGPIRDIEALSQMELPIYGTGTTPGGPYKDGPGEVNVPISCGGVHIEPGDIILADADGIIVIPKYDAERIFQESVKFSANDKAKVVAASNGTADRSWVDKSLAAKNCEIIDAAYPSSRPMN